MVDIVLVCEGPTVRTQEEVPQCNMANPCLHNSDDKKKRLNLSSLFSPFVKFEKVSNIQVKSKQVKSLYVSICSFVVSGFLVDIVLVCEGPTVRTQEEVPQCNMANPCLHNSELFISLFSPFVNFEKVSNIQVKSEQVKSLCFNL